MADNVTKPLPFDVTRAALQLALEALPEIAPVDVIITQIAGGFDIEFTGQLSSQDVAQMVPDDSLLTGGAATATVTEETKGLDTGLNDVQVLTVDATAGTFQLELFLPEVRKTLRTEALAFDASAEQVRRALQHELARELNGLADDADLSRTREAFKSDFSVARIGNTYTIGFQGVTRQIDGGQGVSFLKVIGNAEFTDSGGANVRTRMDGINYYGFEQVNLHLGDGSDVLNVQGTSAGSFKLDLDTVHAATNITLADGDDQIYVSSNADYDHNTIPDVGDEALVDFLTGDLNAVSGNLNLDVGAGTHRLQISDEAATIGDGTLADPVLITDVIGTPTGFGGFDETTAAEIQVSRLAFGDITYGAALPTGNFYDGIVYWTGSGNDTISIDGTHERITAAVGDADRTTTLLNTGLGDDHVTIDLDTGEDGFFGLHTMGGAESPDPEVVTGGFFDDDTVHASESTLPLVIFGGLGDDNITAGQNKDIVFGDFGRVQYLDSTGELIAILGFGGSGDMISSQVLDPTWVLSRDLTLGGIDTLQGHLDEDILIGGAGGDDNGYFGDYIDGDEGDDLIFGDAVRLMRRDTDPLQVGDITNPRFQTLQGHGHLRRSRCSHDRRRGTRLPQPQRWRAVLGRVRNHRALPLRRHRSRSGAGRQLR